MGKTIFFSWQQDLPRETNQNFIENCIRNAIKKVKTINASLVFKLDRATDRVPGSPDIKDSILEKISSSSIFICDISFITSARAIKKCPNPNVLFELGYAISLLGNEKVLCVFNADYGKIENLPFDLRGVKIASFSIRNAGQAKAQADLTNHIAGTIKLLHASGFLFNPLIDYQKSKIDRNILYCAKSISNLVFGTISMSEGLERTTELLNLSKLKLEETLKETSFLGCYFFNRFPEQKKELSCILEVLLSSRYYPRSWSIFIIELLDWLTWQESLTIERYTPFPIIQSEFQRSLEISLIDAHSRAPSNPPGSFILLKKDKNGNQIVQNALNLPGYKSEIDLVKYYKINEKCPELLNNLIFKFITLCNHWMDLTDNEFILDPEYYSINSSEFHSTPQTIEL